MWHDTGSGMDYNTFISFIVHYFNITGTYSDCTSPFSPLFPSCTKAHGAFGKLSDKLRGQFATKCFFDGCHAAGLLRKCHRSLACFWLLRVCNIQIVTMGNLLSALERFISGTKVFATAMKMF